MLQMVHMMLENVNVDEGIVLNNIRAMSLYKQTAPTNYSLMLAEISQAIMKSDEDTPVLEPSPHISPLDTIACEPMIANVLIDTLALLENIQENNTILLAHYLGELAYESINNSTAYNRLITQLNQFKNGELNLCHAKISPNQK